MSWCCCHCKWMSYRIRRWSHPVFNHFVYWLQLLTVYKQLCALVDCLVSDGVVSIAAVHSLSARLNILYCEVQPGSWRGNQRVVAGRFSSEGPGELLRWVGGAGAVEDDGRATFGEERAVVQGRGWTDECSYIFWIGWEVKRTADILIAVKTEFVMWILVIFPLSNIRISSFFLILHD